jgi:hypothetical protein
LGRNAVSGIIDSKRQILKVIVVVITCVSVRLAGGASAVETSILEVALKFVVGGLGNSQKTGTSVNDAVSSAGVDILVTV